MPDEPLIGHHDLVTGITPDVLEVLRQIPIFELLDDRYSPANLVSKRRNVLTLSQCPRASSPIWG